MEDQQKNPRTNSTKGGREDYKTEKNRMDYEGGNQGDDNTTEKETEKDRRTGNNEAVKSNRTSSADNDRRQDTQH